MFGRKKENWEQFRDLINVMEHAEEKKPPEHFISDVMAKLAETKSTPDSFSFGRLFPTHLNIGFQNSVTKTECACYFLLTALFYFILGLIMMIGFPLAVMMQNNSWLSFQPLFGLLLAAVLAGSGIIIYKKNDAAIPLARIGTMIYAALVVLNYGIGAFYVQPVAAIIVVAVFSVTGLVLAVLLRVATDQYQQESFFPEEGR